MNDPGQDLCRGARKCYVYTVYVIVKRAAAAAKENQCLVNPIPMWKNTFCMQRMCYGGGERIRKEFSKAETLEEMAAAYVDYALHTPNEYQLFYSHSHVLSPRKGRGTLRPIRESRPNFAFTEQVLAKRFGGHPDDHTQLALAIWALLHGTTLLLITKSIPEGHEEEMREACRAAVKRLVSKTAN